MIVVTGTGMPPAVVERAIEPFSQLKKSTLGAAMVLVWSTDLLITRSDIWKFYLHMEMQPTNFQIKIFQLDIINIHTKIIWNKDTIQKILSDDT